MSDRPIVVCLGRFGDITSALAIAYDLSRKGPKPYFLVAEPWSSILEGVSYVEPLIFGGGYHEQNRAITWALNNTQSRTIITAQCYMHPHDRDRHTDSYQKESWRVAKWLDKFGTIPTVFDKRDTEREAELLEGIPQGKPIILVSSHGISSPFSDADNVVTKIRAAFGHDYAIVDLSQVKAKRIYDLLGLMDAAELLVATDSAPLHLARASKAPVIAVINDEWLGSVPPPNSFSVQRYADATADTIVQDVDRFLVARNKPRRILHVVNNHGDTERHKRARETWNAVHDNGIGSLRSTVWDRSARDIGDARDLPYLKDMLSAAMGPLSDDDIIIWANSDVGLDHRIQSWAMREVSIWGATAMRRSGEENHMGRDLFAFTVEWLKAHLPAVPDVIIGCPWFDLLLVAMIRKERGIITTKENLCVDFYPCDAAERYALHEPHESSWAGPMENKHPANLHNKKLFEQWTAINMPQLKI